MVKTRSLLGTLKSFVQIHVVTSGITTGSVPWSCCRMPNVSVYVPPHLPYPNVCYKRGVLNWTTNADKRGGRNCKIFATAVMLRKYEHFNCVHELSIFFFLIYFADRASQHICLNINQLDALNFIMSLFHASTCFEHTCSSSGGQNCTIQPLVSSHL